MLQLHAGLSVIVAAAAVACVASAQQVDYYFLIPPDANNIVKPDLQLVVGQTIQAQWHNPGDPINLYLTWCGGSNNQTLLNSVQNTGSASITLQSSYLSNCGDYQLTVLGVQDGVMDWGQPTGSLPFNIVDVENSPDLVASLTTLMVTDTDPVGFATAAATLSVAVSGTPTTPAGGAAPTTSKAAPTTKTTSPTSKSPTKSPSSPTHGSGNGGGGSSHSSGGSGNSHGASVTTTSSNGSASTTLSTASSGTDSNNGATGTNTPTNSDSGLSPQAKVGLGVGIGLGIPLLAVMGVLAWLLNRRNRAASHPAPNQFGIETTQIPNH